MSSQRFLTCGFAKTHGRHQDQYTLSGHAVDLPSNSRGLLDQQSLSCLHTSSSGGTASASGRRGGVTSLADRASKPPIEPPLRTSYTPLSHSHLLPSWPNAMDAMKLSSDDRSEDVTSFFDDEYHVIRSSSLGTADPDDLDYQSNVGAIVDDQQMTESTVKTPATDTVPPSYPCSRQLSQSQHDKSDAPDATGNIQASTNLRTRSSSRDPHDPLSVEKFNVCSVSCSKDYATSGAVNQGIARRDMLPLANDKCWLVSDEGPRGRGIGISERHAEYPNPYSGGVEAAQLPSLLQDVGQLSAEADSTIPDRRVRPLGIDMSPSIAASTPSKVQRLQSKIVPQITIAGPSLTHIHPAYGSGSQHNAWMTPPSSHHSSPHFTFSPLPQITPTAAYTALSPPRTPTSGLPVELDKDMLDRNPFRSANGNPLQFHGTTTPSSPFNILPTTNISHGPNAEGPLLLLHSVYNVTPTLTHPTRSAPCNDSASTSSESIQCTLCPKKTFHGNRAIQLRSLKRHMETRHGGEEYECVYCGDRLARSDYRVRHLQLEKHGFQFPPTPRNRKRDPAWESFLQTSFRKVAVRKVGT